MHTNSRKMKTVCNKNLDVFDFKDESPRVALRITSKLDKIRNAAIDKYTFLATGKFLFLKIICYIPSCFVSASSFGISDASHADLYLKSQSLLRILESVKCCCKMWSQSLILLILFCGVFSA